MLLQLVTQKIAIWTEFDGFRVGTGWEPIWTRTEEEIRSTPNYPIGTTLPRKIGAYLLLWLAWDLGDSWHSMSLGGPFVGKHGEPVTV